MSEEAGHDFIFVTKTDTWHDKQILIEAKKAGLIVEKVDFCNWEEFIKIDWSVAPVVFWRSSSLGQGDLRLKALKNLEKKDKIIVNQGWTKFPRIPQKAFQQKQVAQFLGEELSIATFTFESKKELVYFIKKNCQLNFPIIKKPNLGFRGIGVSKINNLEELKKISDKEIQGSVFQKFIENDGDYRVLVLGGRPLGVMKRVAGRGGFLNNISQGGLGLKVDNTQLKNELMDSAAKIAAVFDLGFCGVDLIINKKDSKISFLEINTVPQWQGFQKTNKINVGRAVVDYCFNLGNRSNESPGSRIEKFYSSAFFLPDDKKFHFYSRLYLWTGKQKYYRELLKIEDYFLGGKNKEGWDAGIKDLIVNELFYRKKAINNRIFREKVIERYPRLGLFHELLFRSLLAKSIFRVDWWKQVVQQVPEDSFLVMGKKLLANRKDIKTLSTFAVNYLFFLAYFWPKSFPGREVEKTILFLAEATPVEKGSCDEIKNCFYFLSHCLIAKSLFYSSCLVGGEESFEWRIIGQMEKILEQNFSGNSLDGKLEFLVGCDLVNKKTGLKSRIIQEAEKSFSPIGNFLIDKNNFSPKESRRRSFFISEHRNVLYLMVKYGLSKKAR